MANSLEWLTYNLSTGHVDTSIYYSILERVNVGETVELKKRSISLTCNGVEMHMVTVSSTLSMKFSSEDGSSQFALNSQGYLYIIFT